MPVLCMSNLLWPQQMALSGLVFTAWVIAALQDKMFSKKIWPPQSPDLTSPNFFLRGCLKERVYRKKLRTTEALKDNIRLKISKTEKNVLW
jgi:hypothetical protein